MHQDIHEERQKFAGLAQALPGHRSHGLLAGKSLILYTHELRQFCTKALWNVPRRILDILESI